MQKVLNSIKFKINSIFKLTRPKINSGLTKFNRKVTLHRSKAIGNLSQFNYKRRPLTIIFAWLLAKDKHLDKYRELWFKRGFDVLTVKTTPLNVLFPQIGCKLNAQNLVEILSQLNSEYKDLVAHTFSTGGYQFGEVVLNIYSSSTHYKLIDSIKGEVMDSTVVPNDSSKGLAKTLTNNDQAQRLIENVLRVFHQTFYNSTQKHYDQVAEFAVSTPLKWPGIVFYSKDDVLSNYENLEEVINMRKGAGQNIVLKRWDQSAHVLHYKLHQIEYEQELDAFIKRLSIY